MAKLNTKNAVAAAAVGLLGASVAGYQHKLEADGKLPAKGWQRSLNTGGRAAVGVAAIGAYMYMKNPQKWGLEGAAYGGAALAASTLGEWAFANMGGYVLPSAVKRVATAGGAYIPGAEIAGALGAPNARGRVMDQEGRRVLRVDM